MNTDKIKIREAPSDSMSAEEILACNHPEELFFNPKNLDEEYATLKAKWVPKQILWDTAGDVLKRIDKLYNLVKDKRPDDVWTSENTQVKKKAPKLVERAPVEEESEDDVDDPAQLLSNIINNRPIKFKGPGSILLTIRCPNGDTIICPVRTVSSSINKNGDLVLSLPGENASTIHKTILEAKIKNAL